MDPLSIFGAIGGIFKPLIAPVAQHFKAKQAIKAAKVNSEIAIIKAKTQHVQAMAQNKAQAEVDWNIASIENSGWKDEFYVILFAIPLVMCFIPGLDVYVTRGFTALKETPEWYRWAIGIMVSASFGYQKFANSFGKKK